MGGGALQMKEPSNQLGEEPLESNSEEGSGKQFLHCRSPPPTNCTDLKKTFRQFCMPDDVIYRLEDTAVVTG